MRALQNKTSLNIVDGKVNKRPRSIVIFSTSSIDYTKEKEFNNKIFQLNTKIAKQANEIASLKEKLAAFVTSNKSLAKLFESCVSEFTASQARKQHYSLDTNSSDSSVVSQMLTKPSVVTHFSSEAKGELFEFFLRHDTAIKKLAEIVAEQFYCREQVNASSAKSNAEQMPRIQRNDKRTTASITCKGTRAACPVKLNKSKIIFQEKELPEIMVRQQSKMPVAYLTLQNKCS
eukprot:TRINITY_DN3650_c0_g1_i9.p1 TRINITY_DN3650_c0_g1~~TRINITY_DN3650_c0_g1_i9.p1  ORF type:complete len:232 (+),score=43.97 TRINITY_DN3650_c0_g1_i9:130-825(+)